MQFGNADHGGNSNGVKEDYNGMGELSRHLLKEEEDVVATDKV